MQKARNTSFSTQPLAAFRHLFRSLPAPASDLQGQFYASFIGPLWLRTLAPTLLPLGGLSGWVGKTFTPDGSANNLLRHQDRLVERVPMIRSLAPSRLDQSPCLALTYDHRAPLGLRRLRDELRTLDDNTLLGLTFVELPWVRRFPMPFLLERMP